MGIGRTICLQYGLLATPLMLFAVSFLLSLLHWVVHEDCTCCVSHMGVVGEVHDCSCERNIVHVAAPF